MGAYLGDLKNDRRVVWLEPSARGYNYWDGVLSCRALWIIVGTCASSILCETGGVEGFEELRDVI